MSSRDRIAAVLDRWHSERLSGGESDVDELLRGFPDLSTEELEEIRERVRALQALDLVLTDTPRQPPDPPHEFGDYLLLREIGRGGMGVVYEARQRSVDRRVALKVLIPSLTSAHRSVQRFRREAMAAGRLHHTNVVPVYAMGEESGYWFYSMELVSESTLGGLIAELREAPAEDRFARGLARIGGAGSERKQPSGGKSRDAWYRRVAEVFAGVAEGLDAAHEEGVVHRDIKPSNLLLDADGTLKIVDFGLAHLDTKAPSITVTGDVLGTPTYMSPEQARGRRDLVDHRTDVYSLGAALYETLTLEPPFDGDTPLHQFSQVVLDDPVPPRKQDARIPRDLETIVLRAMAKDRDDRYPSAIALARDLRRHADGMPVSARRPSLAERAWRRVKRHRVVSGLLASLVVLGAVATALGVLASRESDRRAELEREQEFGRLLGEAFVIESSRSPDLPWEDAGGGAGSARAVLDRAIAVSPERPEAWLARALLPGVAPEDRLADIERARENGLSPGTFHAARAHVLAAKRDWAEVEREGALAAGYPDGGATGAFFAGSLAVARHELAEAIEAFSRAIEGSEAGSMLWFLAHSNRARLHEQLGHRVEALRDLNALQSVGEDSLSLRLRVAALWRDTDPSFAEEELASVLEEACDEATEAEWLELGRACLASRATDWHTRVAREGARRFPGSARLLTQAAGAHQRNDEHEECKRLASLALEIDPELHGARQITAVALAAQGRGAEAEAIFRESPNCHYCTVRVAGFMAWRGEREAALEHFERALELLPSSAFAHTQRAQAWAGLGEHEKAEEDYETALSLDPLFASGHLNYGTFLANDLDDPARAQPHFETARRLDPELDEAVGNLAIVLERQGRHEEALEAFQEAVRRWPARFPPRAGLWQALRSLGREEKRRAAIAGTLDEDLPEGPQADHTRGHALQELGRWPEALEAYEAALVGRPDWAHLWGDIGLTLQNMGDPAGAVDAYERAIELDDERAVFHNNLGNALKGIGELDRAEDAFDRAIELDPDFSDAYFNRSGVHYLRGDFELSLADVEEALRIDDGVGDYWNRKGGCLVGLGLVDEALAALDRAVELDDWQPDPLVSRGWVLNDHLGRHEEARDDFLLAIERDPDCFQAWHNLGVACEALGRFEEAADAAERFLELRPDHGPNHWRLLWLLGELGDLERTRDELRRWAELHETRPGAWNHLAWFLVDPAGVPEQHDPVEGLAAARRAVELSAGENPEFLDTLAWALHRGGEHAESVATEERALELLPDDHPDRAAFESSLESFRAELQALREGR